MLVPLFNVQITLKSASIRTLLESAFKGDCIYNPVQKNIGKIWGS